MKGKLVAGALALLSQIVSAELWLDTQVDYGNQDASKYTGTSLNYRSEFYSLLFGAAVGARWGVDYQNSQQNMPSFHLNTGLSLDLDALRLNMLYRPQFLLARGTPNQLFIGSRLEFSFDFPIANNTYLGAGVFYNYWGDVAEFSDGSGFLAQLSWRLSGRTQATATESALTDVAVVVDDDMTETTAEATTEEAIDLLAIDQLPIDTEMSEIDNSEAQANEVEQDQVRLYRRFKGNTLVCKCSPQGPWVLQIGEFSDMETAISALSHPVVDNFFSGKQFQQSSARVYISRNRSSTATGIFLGDFNSEGAMESHMRSLKLLGLNPRKLLWSPETLDLMPAEAIELALDVKGDLNETDASRLSPVTIAAVDEDIKSETVIPSGQTNSETLSMTITVEAAPPVSAPTAVVEQFSAMGPLSEFELNAWLGDSLTQWYLRNAPEPAERFALLKLDEQWWFLVRSDQVGLWSSYWRRLGLDSKAIKHSSQSAGLFVDLFWPEVLPQAGQKFSSTQEALNFIESNANSAHGLYVDKNRQAKVISNQRPAPTPAMPEQQQNLPMSDKPDDSPMNEDKQPMSESTTQTEDRLSERFASPKY